jgi:hypothetical protein
MHRSVHRPDQSDRGIFRSKLLNGILIGIADQKLNSGEKPHSGLRECIVSSLFEGNMGKSSAF